MPGYELDTGRGGKVVVFPDGGEQACELQVDNDLYEFSLGNPSTVVHQRPASPPVKAPETLTRDDFSGACEVIRPPPVDDPVPPPPRPERASAIHNGIYYTIRNGRAETPGGGIADP